MVHEKVVQLATVDHQRRHLKVAQHTGHVEGGRSSKHRGRHARRGAFLHEMGEAVRRLGLFPSEEEPGDSLGVELPVLFDDRTGGLDNRPCSVSSPVGV